ncbi:MAG: hypothetical protein KC505_01230 [Myxococcales bacterium]|nr:hypothetical protein [Myxococcales bacterium]USN51479.1 MAG: hypothetical protein H6731_03465 [Myxococcales bacterium]
MSKIFFFCLFFIFIVGCHQNLLEEEFDGKFLLHNRLFSILSEGSYHDIADEYRKKIETQLLLSDYHNAPPRENPFTLMGRGKLNFSAYHRFETYSKVEPSLVKLYKQWHKKQPQTLGNVVLNDYITNKPVQSPVSNEYIVTSWLDEAGVEQVYQTLFGEKLNKNQGAGHRLIGNVVSMHELFAHEIYKQFMSAYRLENNADLFGISSLYIDSQLKVLAQNKIDEAASKLNLSKLYQSVYNNILFAMDIMLDINASPELYIWLNEFVNNNIKILLVHEPFNDKSLNDFIADLYPNFQVNTSFASGGMNALQQTVKEISLVDTSERVIVSKGSYFEFISLIKTLNKKNINIYNKEEFINSLDSDARPINTLLLECYDAYSRKSLDPLEWVKLAQERHIPVSRVVIDITHEAHIASARLKKIVTSLQNSGIQVDMHRSGHKWDLIGNDDRSLGLFMRFNNKGPSDELSRKYNPLTFQYYVLSLKALYLNPQLILTELFQNTLNKNANQCRKILDKPLRGLKEEDVQFLFLPIDSIGIRHYFDTPFYTRASFAYLLPASTPFSGENNRVIFGALPQKSNSDFCHSLKIFIQSKTRRNEVLNANVTELKKVTKENSSFAYERAKKIEVKIKTLEEKKQKIVSKYREMVEVIDYVIERSKIRRNNLIDLLN